MVTESIMFVETDYAEKFSRSSNGPTLWDREDEEGGWGTLIWVALKVCRYPEY